MRRQVADRIGARRVAGQVICLATPPKSFAFSGQLPHGSFIPASPRKWLSLQTHRDMSVLGEAASGEAACTLYAELAPDVLVLDLTMPGMAGSRR
jgi:hypothetical protein